MANYLAALTLVVAVASACDLPDACSNGGSMQLSFLMGGSDEPILPKCGEQLTKEQTANEPSIMFTEARKEKTYLLLMVDPDSPSQDPWRHWLLANIKGRDIVGWNKISGTATEITDYNGPSPPSGVHSYNFYLFEQQEKTITPPSVPSERGQWHLSQFLADNSLCDHWVASTEIKVGH